MSVKVKFRLDILKQYKNMYSKSFLEKLGDFVVDEVKDNASKGISSVKGGKSRYPAYKNPKKYPRNLKPKRPVNLKLSGKMLDALEAKVKTVSDGAEIRFGFKNDTEADKYETHHFGKFGVPIRKLIPIDVNEEFTTKLSRKILKLIEKRIRKFAQKTRR